MTSPFGEELTLSECLEILRETEKSNLPDRAKFWERNMNEVQDSLMVRATSITVEGFNFKVEYFARISAAEGFAFSQPFAYIKIGANGSDSQSRDSDNSITDRNSDPDI